MCYQALQYAYDDTAPPKSDCLSAIAKLRVNGSVEYTICFPESALQADSPPPLVSDRTCEIVLQGAADKCFPGLQLADVATKLADACTNLDSATSGSRIIQRAPESQRYNDISISVSKLQAQR